MSEEERITYEEFMIMYRNAPRFAYTLYDKAEDEIDRLNNIINGLEEYIKPYLYMLNGIQDRDIYEQCQLDDFTDIMDKLKELKNGDNNEKNE